MKYFMYDDSRSSPVDIYGYLTETREFSPGTVLYIMVIQASNISCVNKLFKKTRFVKKVDR